jgi:predicted permease
MEGGRTFRRLFRLERGTAGVEQDVDTELAFHLDMATEEMVARGMQEAEARAEAERRFRDLDRTRQELAALGRARASHERRARWGAAFVQDLRYAVRGLRRRPGFTLGVILTLALGIGANATMFGIVDRLLFRPPAFLPAPDQVHRVYFVRTFDGIDRSTSNTSHRRYQDIRASARSFSEIAGFWRTELAIGIGEEAREVNVATVTPEFWRIFDAQPHQGRFFGAEEDRLPAGAPVVVVGYEYWQSALGGREVIGTQLRIGQRDYAVIGIAPRGFDAVWTAPSAAFIPLSAGGAELSAGGGPHFANEYGFSWMQILVRRKPGMTVEAASADLTRAYLASYSAQRQEMPALDPAEEVRPRALATSVLFERGPNQSSVTRVAMWLVGVSVIVLVIACANVGNLLLARALSRRREIAVRLALGVSRGRLLGQFLLESMLLAGLGAMAGLLLAQWGSDFVRVTLLPDAGWPDSVFDARLVAFTGVAALAAGIVAGAAPILQARRADVSAELKAGAREGTYQRSRLRMSLLVVQCALSVVLLAGAALFIRSFRNVSDVRLGYEPDRVLYVSTQLRGEPLADEAGDLLKERLRAAAAALPAVEAASRTLTVPFFQSVDLPIFVAGIDSVDRLGIFTQQAASPDYFRTMGTRLLRGRPITEADRRGAPLVMVVSASMARTLWPRGDAIGQCVQVGADTMPCTTVVGIAEDIKRESFTDDAGLLYYLAMAQYPPGAGGLFVRTRGPASGQAEAVRRGLQALMPGASYVNVVPLDELVAPNLQSWRVGATMFSAFGLLALLVAVVGLYSVIAYNVSQRTHELGVRVALGARRSDIVALVLRDAFRLALVAVALGAGGVLYAGRWLEPLLFETSAKDPRILAGVAGALLVVAALASVVPARRAARVDPAVALRAD